MQDNRQKSWNDSQTERDGLDCALDAALAKYSAVEPRAGLEQRVLARLRSRHEAIPTRSWWQWSAVGTLAVLLVIVAALAWKWSEPAKMVTQRHPSAPNGTVQRPVTPASSELHADRLLNEGPSHTRLRRNHAPSAVAHGPKLDQFPSPRPLTPEELALARYARQFPQDAMMIASAQEEFEKEVQQEAASSGQATINSIEEER
jgi:hypothetical protein